MKRNHRYLSIVLSAVVGLSAAACISDDAFLTEQPKALLTVENAFDAPEQILNTLLTGYNEFNDFYIGGMMGYSYANGTDLIDQKFNIGQTGHMSNFEAAWSTTSSMPKDLWDKFYRVISYSNLALDQVDNVSWESESDRKRIVAEAYFLRGLSYMRLGELFGGVPLQTEYSENPRFDYDRASRTETYDLAIDDLLRAYEGLPAQTGADRGRAGKGAAATYLAEAYLARGVEKGDDKSDYSEAAKYAQACIDLHPLMKGRFGVRAPGATGSNYGVPNEYLEGNVFTDLFSGENVRSVANTEAVWVIMTPLNYEQRSEYGGSIPSTIGTTPAIQDFRWAPAYQEEGAAAGPWKAYSAKYGGAMGPAFQGGIGWACTTPTDYAAVTLWDAEHNNNSTADYRYIEDVSVQTKYLCCDENHSLYEQKVGWDEIDHSTPEMAGNYYPIFYKETPFSKWDFDENQPAGWFGNFTDYYRSRYAIRSVEAWFLLAEAKLRSGDTAGATDAVNEVRTRSHANPFSTITLDIILDERGREMLYEEFRWATLLRLKPAEWKQRLYDHGMYCARPGATIYPEIRRWAEYTKNIPWDLFPIPQTYIDLNNGSEGMPQNEGWT